jgi:hypothetical protein
MALIQGMENANKTRVRFGWCANGGFLEGAGLVPFPRFRLDDRLRWHLERQTGEHHRLLVFQTSPRTINQGCSGAGYLVEHLPSPPPCQGPLGSHRPRAAMLEAEITQTWMFVRTAPKRPVVLAI